MTAPVETSFAASPFHAGEIAVQTLAGSREAMAAIGARVIRTAMPDQHRQFFAQLPFLVVGALDARGQPWATLLSGTPGFAHSPDATRLRIDTLPPSTDPLHGAMTLGAPIGILGLEPSTRRRNRVNGPVVEADTRGFAIRVAQSFGNCPQYIRKRDISPDGHDKAPRAEPAQTSLDDDAQWQIASADTFFVATHYASDGAAQHSAGADVSHRGGKPGFVRVEDAHTLTWPDFRGNAFYNTLGNLHANPRAGLVFVDFASGDFLHVAGSAEILWHDEAQSGFEGAQRLVRLRVHEVRRVRGALPARWRDGETSPSVERTGAWPAA
ncbi:pyridoxamine 5'-phosphate oxidase-like FMN-binding protein [Pandoraea communis]|uniref:Pyridoxamine 5'-phosphate oxidase-like FMN-binding protein n=1 Tax=Pandoraea communis TaxID=2508297 RepID=A0A5E4SD57_9BURK|nr:pyridoxamine 5'-phosphate oxidase family protein [Pandoraea communis]VVD71979.1 pyridoxamine 5'-phosphate oxidase-like FMN-binding protein [Pandoraea communis]